MYFTKRLNTRFEGASLATDQLSATFAALADPTRRAILARLVLGETSVTELAEPFQMTLPAVTKHLKVLQHAGLITRGRHAQWRPCRIEALPLAAAAAWMEPYRAMWETKLDRLDDYLRELQRGDDGGAPSTSAR
jgi:DNA-binding transcriptional ArsR family regulator